MTREAALRRRLEELRDPEFPEDDELVRRMLGGFLERASTSLHSLATAAEAGRAGDVEHLAHALKGAALNLGADELGRLTALVEEQGRGASLEATPVVLEQVRAELRALEPLLVALRDEIPA